MNETIREVAPFWFWNDKLDSEKLLAQLRDIHDHGIEAVTIHARFGLPSDSYLSEEMFRCVGFVLNRAQDLNMKVWIYDDFNWPSGRAGGKVTENPDFRAKTFKVDRRGQIIVKESEFEPAYSNGSYVDVLSRAATDTFIDLTHEEYYRRFSHLFGGPIEGFYVDEPGSRANFMGVLNRGSLPYTDRMPGLYEEIHHRKFTDDVPLIWSSQNSSEVRSARLRFWGAFITLYSENYLARRTIWCRIHNTQTTGHVLVEENPLELIKTQGDPFFALAQFNIPGFDIIGGFHPESQILAAKLAQSVAKTYGKSGVMAEVFGGFGDVSTSDMEQVIEWVVKKAGVTMLVPHALFYSQEGDRIYDHPPVLNSSFYWPQFPNLLSRFRKEAEKSQAHPKDAVYFPTNAMQATYNPSHPGQAEYISRALQKKAADLVRNGIDFELLDNIGVNRRMGDFDRIHIPASTVMSVDTLSEIAYFGREGGTVVFLGEKPQFALREEDQPKFDTLMDNLVKHGQIEDGDFPNLRRRKNIWSWIDPTVAGLDYKIYHRLSIKSPKYAHWYTNLKGKMSNYWGKIERRFAK